jgi:glycerophosphoryl diester phosphodiesterase
VTSTSFSRTRPRIASPAAAPWRTGGPAVVAHRGASAVAPENTLAALQEAVRRGADAVEFDVRRSRDGALVLCHDDTLERTTDARRVLPGRAPWRVGELTLDELSRVDAGAWHGPSYAGERIPTLAAALEMLRPTGVTAVVELKSPSDHPATVPDLVEVLTRTRLVPDRITVQSFDAGAVLELRQRLPAVRAGVLLRRATRSRIRELAGWADLVNVHHQWLGAGTLQEARAHGLECYAWTVNQPAALRRMLALGVDGIVTDHPERLATLQGRVTGSGAWWPNGTSWKYPSAASTLGSNAFAVRR